jgi:hypothetical protein
MRFEVFKRDSFTCQYCSAKPPRVPLEIDHINPVSKGGKNNIDNLITACFDCNRGKSDKKLSSVPQTIVEKTALKQEALKQYQQYQKVLKKEAKIIDDAALNVQLIFAAKFPGWGFSDSFKVSVKKFIKTLGEDVVCDNMERACLKMHGDSGYALKYFCGICWNQIREGVK